MSVPLERYEYLSHCCDQIGRRLRLSLHRGLSWKQTETGRMKMILVFVDENDAALDVDAAAMMKKTR